MIEFTNRYDHLSLEPVNLFRLKTALQHSQFQKVLFFKRLRVDSIHHELPMQDLLMKQFLQYWEHLWIIKHDLKIRHVGVSPFQYLQDASTQLNMAETTRDNILDDHFDGLEKVFHILRSKLYPWASKNRWSCLLLLLMTEWENQT